MLRFKSFGSFPCTGLLYSLVDYSWFIELKIFPNFMWLFAVIFLIKSLNEDLKVKNEQVKEFERNMCSLKVPNKAKEVMFVNKLRREDKALWTIIQRN